MQVRIILVHPQESGNVGAAARAMKNFGFTDLWIVGDREKHAIDEKSTWWAMGADDVLSRLTRVASLSDALAGCTLSVATTAVRSRQVSEQLTPEEVARLAREELGASDRIAIVFGREKWGLTGEEIALCQRTASIPTWPEFPTMNLAQSVAVFSYELGKHRPRPQKDPDLPPRELTVALETHARALMEQIDFYGVKRPERICLELQAIAGRAVLTRREASLLLALIRQTQSRLTVSE
ncbi:MAG TPA: RNA methyltransferase [Thermoanaerobaculia bacterium]|nr:RNA methyltransferase [Thermoanaerobaculia bacterium]